MNPRRISLLLLAPWADAFSLSSTPLTATHHSDAFGRTGTALHFRDYPASHYELFEDFDAVDGERTSASSLIDPSSAPTNASKSSERKPASNSRAVQRASPITQLHTIQDYHRHVLNEPNQLCIVRFSASWCPVCRTTNVAWERLAAKLGNGMNAKDGTAVKFLSVHLDGRNEATEALKDMLQIDRVPQGIVHHPRQSIFGRKVELNRKKLSVLKKELERYLGSDHGNMEGGALLETLYR